MAIFTTIMAIVSILSVIFVLFFMPTQNIDMDRKTTPDVTTANEGAVVPVVFGTVRLTPNIIGYGNFLSKKAKKSGQTIGYNYWLDVWMGICMGKVTIDNIFTKGKDEDPKTTSTAFNDGTGASYPIELGEFANPLPGIAHYFFERMHLGLESTFVPSIDFIVTREIVGTIPILYPILTNGFNPAVIIYLILVDKNVSLSKIDVAKFNVAATYWNDKDYGLNIKIRKKMKTKEAIKKVLSYVDGIFGKDYAGRYFIKAFDPLEASVATIANDDDNDDFLEFEFVRKTWHDTYNEFKGAFTDKDNEYSERQLVVRNRANINLQNRIRSTSVDLDAFIDSNNASKRLWEIAKKESYPYARCNFTTNLSFRRILVGDIVTIVNVDEGIVSADFRILKKRHYSNDKNKVSFESEQVVETLFDDVFTLAGSTEYVAETYIPSALVKQKIFEMPYNSIYKHEIALLLLASRVGTFENGFNVQFSSDDITYEDEGNFGDWSMYGVLSETYSSSTDFIDDDTTISFTPYSNDPEFLSVSRAALFTSNRYALMGDEIVRFQTINLLEGKYHLGGIIRGCFNTTIATHNSASDIWIFTIGDNILTGIVSSDFYIKMLPYFMSNVVVIGDATPINVTPTAKAMIPFAVCSLKAVRTGSSIAVEWIPTNQDIEGAGAFSADIQKDQAPSAYDQDFEIKETAAPTPVIVDGVSTIITNAIETTISVRAKRSGYASTWISVLVEVADGTYIA